MTSPFLGEFLGTMVLIILGDGVVAGVLLKRSKGAKGAGLGGDHRRVGLCGHGWRFFHGHWPGRAAATRILNPAVTLGFSRCVRVLLRNALPVPSGGRYWGAVCGATVVWIHYSATLEGDPGRGRKRLACFLHRSRRYGG